MLDPLLTFSDAPMTRLAGLDAGLMVIGLATSGGPAEEAGVLPGNILRPAA